MNNWTQVDDPTLPEYRNVELDLECDRSLNTVHVDGADVEFPNDRKTATGEEIDAWWEGLNAKAKIVSELLSEFGLECDMVNILDKVHNPFGLVANLQVRKIRNIPTKMEGNMAVPEWYEPTKWPENNPDGDEFQKIIASGCLPEIPPP